jgi:RNA polymerase sigma factor (sigma-70 family)
VNEQSSLAATFEMSRPHLRAVAYRMLGSENLADDAVQESWLRLSRSDTSDVENLRGWLTTVVARVCLDMLRSKKSRKEVSMDSDEAESHNDVDDRSEPQGDVPLADSVGSALLVVLDTLSPAERVAFVLHDVFAVPFDEIAPIVGRSTEAARQLASRARRRVQAAPTILDGDGVRQREIVQAFLEASRRGDFEALLAVLDPQIVLHADATAVAMGSTEVMHGADAVAAQFSGRAQAAQLALLNDSVGLMWAVGGKPRVAFEFVVAGERVVEICLVADHEYLDQLDWAILDD